MKTILTLPALIALSLGVASAQSSPCHATPAATAPTPHYTPLGWFGSQQWWKGQHALFSPGLMKSSGDHGITLSGSYIADFLGNVSGGKKQAFCYTHSIALQGEFDFDKMIGWKGGSGILAIQDNAGPNLANRIGNIMNPSNLYGPPTFMFAQLSLQQNLWDDFVQIKAGRMTMTTDWLASDIFGYYVNVGFDGEPMGIALNSPWAAWPAPTWGSLVRVGNNTYYGQLGVYQATTYYPDANQHGLNMKFEGSDGMLMLWELGWNPTFKGETLAPNSPRRTPGRPPAPSSYSGSSSPATQVLASGKGQAPMYQETYPGAYKIGGWWTHWSEQKDYAGFTKQDSTGFYALAQQRVYTEPGTKDQGLTLWSSVVYAPTDSSTLEPYTWNVYGGFIYKGMLTHRPDDVLLFGVAWSQASRDLRSDQIRNDELVQSSEMDLELGYLIQVNQWMYIQPDIQYIVRPGASSQYDDALVIGAQLGITF